MIALPDVASQCNAGTLEQRLARKLAFVEELKTMPIAIETKTANEQHYEVRTCRFNLHIQQAATQGSRPLHGFRTLQQQQHNDVILSSASLQGNLICWIHAQACRRSCSAHCLQHVCSGCWTVGASEPCRDQHSPTHAGNCNTRLLHHGQPWLTTSLPGFSSEPLLNTTSSTLPWAASSSLRARARYRETLSMVPPPRRCPPSTFCCVWASTSSTAPATTTAPATHSTRRRRTCSVSSRGPAPCIVLQHCAAPCTLHLAQTCSTALRWAAGCGYLSVTADTTSSPQAAHVRALWHCTMALHLPSPSHRTWL